MMNKNMNSPTKLTEFAPLSNPEENQPAVSSLFSKFFGFSKSSASTTSSTTTTATTTNTTMTVPTNIDKQQNTSIDSDSEREKLSSNRDDTASSINFSLDASEGRSLPNVLKRISNIVALKSNNLKSYKDSELRSFWMPDSVAKQCYECGERFTAFRRKHHCRVCGQIFCSKCCSDEIPGKIMGCTGDLRVCTYCCKVVLSYLESSDMRSVLSADLKALQEDLQVKYGNDSQSRAQQGASNDSLDDDPRAISRKPSVGYMEEKYALGRSSSGYLAASQEPSLLLQNSPPLRMIYEELFRSSFAIPLQTHRVRLKSFYNCFMADELVNWMLMQKKAITRVQGAAIGQALLEAGFIESAQSENLHFFDGPVVFKPTKLSIMRSIDLSDQHRTICDSQEPAWVKNIPQHDSTTDSEGEIKVSSLSMSSSLSSSSPPLSSPQSQPDPSPLLPPPLSQGSSVQTLGRLPSSSSSFYLDLNLEASTVTLKRPICSNTLDEKTDKSISIPDAGGGDISAKTVASIATTSKREINLKSHLYESSVTDELLSDTLNEFKERNSWRNINNPRSTSEEITAYNALEDRSAYQQHQDSLIRQLLNKEGLSESWREPILSLGHNIVDKVRPDLYHDADDMDIGHYVQIKKLPGGRRTDCEIVSGVVCSKNIAHRGMNAVIVKPKILLLECGLMYQRVEGKLLSLEPVMLQEKEYLGQTVARITALGPNVVLVHRSVSRLAQEKFRERGITLVLNVKLSVLERVARCTGGTIVSTIDAHLTTRYKLGTCEKFYLRNFPNESGTSQPGKTLMYFEGCANGHLGATILLRGGTTIGELKKVKNIMSTIIFSSYSWRLEKSFLINEFAKAPFSLGDNTFLDQDSTPIIGDEILSKVQNNKKEPVIEANSSSAPITEIKKIDEEDSFMSVETFKRVSTMLEHNTDPYDTLKLFKTKMSLPKLTSAADEDTRNNHKLGDKIISDEKRIYGESVSDQSDPLHQYLMKDNDDENDIENTTEDDKKDKKHSIDNERLDLRLDETDDVFGKQNNLATNSNHETDQQSLSVADLPLLNKFKKALDDTILSFSPYLKFSVPYLETEAGRNCALRKFFPKDIFYSGQLLTATSNSISTPIVTFTDNRMSGKLRLKPEHPFVKEKFTSSIESRQVQSLLANFRACGSRLYSSMDNTENSEQGKLLTVEKQPIKRMITKNSWPDCLEAANHQRLSVLFCSFSHSINNAPAFCVNPSVVNMDLYGRNDIALGRFLERYCLTSEYKCPAQSCRAQIAQHARRFAHDGGCVHISITELCSDPFEQATIDTEGILMWTKCLDCKTVSPVVPMSSDTWSLSFAKYLELRFHGNIYTKRSTPPITKQSTINDDYHFNDKDLQQCRHSLHHRHSQYFTKKNMLTIFKYTKISLWEISLPPPLIYINYDVKQRINVIEEMKILALKGDEVFTNIRDKLSNIQLELDGCLITSGGANNTATVNNNNISIVVGNAKQQLMKEQQYFKNKIDEIQLKLTEPVTLLETVTSRISTDKQLRNLMFRIEDGIVLSKRLISEAVNNWNIRIQEIAASAKRKDEKSRRFVESKSQSSGSGCGGSVTAYNNSTIILGNENDGYVTEDTASESQIDDLSPMSADYSAIDAISAVVNRNSGNATNADYFQTTVNNEIGEYSDNENRSVDNNIEEIVAVSQESPKYHQRSYSDVLPISLEQDIPDRKKKKKTNILSQLLPATASNVAMNHLISNPLSSFEHHLLPLGSVVPMVVYESEPSSIIAYALDSHDYKHALAEIIRSCNKHQQGQIGGSTTVTATESNSSPLYKRKFSDNKDNLSGTAATNDSTQSLESKRPSVLSFLRGNSPCPASPMETITGTNEPTNKPMNSGVNITATVSPAVESSSLINNNHSTILSASASGESEDDKRSSIKQQTYIEVQFNDATTNFYCRIYFAAQFAGLRENVLPSGEDGFTRSICRSIQWAARGGKSGSAFCKSRDDRFIIKELSRLELQIFLEFAPNYFAYMEKCQHTKQPTLLGKIVGVYRVSFKNNTTNAALRTSVLVMENLFYGRAITDKFDLKGSVRNRLVNPEEADSEGELVLLDENLLNMSCDSPLYIRSHSKAVLNKAIEQDTKFLADNSVMDYSLLVGLEPNSDELVLGIIDYIRTFTWDKKLETMVKKSGILGGQGKLPTIVSPEEYRARFIAAMHRYFLPVPDRWTGLARGVDSAS